MFLENALEMITSVWTNVGTGSLASIRPMLTPWCSHQWEQALPRFVPVHPPSLAIDHLSLDRAVPGDDVDVVEVSILPPEGQPRAGFQRPGHSLVPERREAMPRSGCWNRCARTTGSQKSEQRMRGDSWLHFDSAAFGSISWRGAPRSPDGCLPRAVGAVAASGRSSN